MRTVCWLAIAALLMMPLEMAGAADGALSIKGVRHFSYPTFTRIVFEVEKEAPYTLTKSADGRSLVLSAYDGELTVPATLPSIRDGVISGLEKSVEAERVSIVIGLDAAAGEVKDFALRGPDRIVVDVAKTQAAPPPEKPASSTVVIVIDAGHGGKNGGIVTPRGVEKSLTLAAAQTLAKAVRKRLPNATVLLTRDKDRDLSLDERAVQANAAGAVLFISLHAAPGREARVYFAEPSGEQARQAPARRTDFLGMEAESEQQAMLWGRQQAAYTAKSSKLAARIGQSLAPVGDPVQAPLALLKAIDAAAALVEFGAEQSVAATAESVSRGIERYVREN
jgi:N-acetylmuramoyl-L-alanine amidase